MRYFIMRRLPVLFLFVSLNGGLSAQQSHWPDHYHRQTEKAEKKYGPDDILVFGKVYFQLHYKADGHPFLSETFSSGTVYIGQRTFFDVPLRFDTERQVFLIKVRTRNESQKLVWLNPQRIDSVKLLGRLFRHTSQLEKNLPREGYYEIIGRGEMKMFIFHHKYYKAVRNITGDNSVGRYTKLYYLRFLQKAGKLLRVNSRRNFITAFDQKSKVRRFIRQNSIKYRKAESQQLQSLLNYCNDELSDKN